MNRDEIAAIYNQGVDAMIDFVEQLLRALQQQQTLIEQQQVRIDSLAARVEELEQRLAQDSRNSNKPPSSDPFIKQTRSLRESTGRQSGGQKGHRGSSLPHVTVPDRVVVHGPERCATCGASLTDVEREVTAQRRQVFDIPPLKLEVTEHRLGVSRCPCCERENSGEFPSLVPCGASYGAGVKALAVFLHKEHLLPWRRTCEIIESLFGQPFSEGTVQHVVADCAAELSEMEHAIKAAISAAAQAHFDETGMYVENTRGWLHVAATGSLTAYAYHAKRGTEASREIGILPVFRGTATHDCLSSYFTYQACAHSLCNVHHLRELTFAHEVMNREWAGEMKELLKKIKQEVDRAKAEEQEEVSAQVSERLHEQYDSILKKGFLREALEPALASGRRGKQKQSKAKNLLDRLHKYKEETLKFMTDFRVPFDNNLAERDLRMMKVQQKISGCFRTRKGAEDFCRIRSYLSTMKKQGHNLLEVLKSVFTGSPVFPALTG